MSSIGITSIALVLALGAGSSQAVLASQGFDEGLGLRPVGNYERAEVLDVFFARMLRDAFALVRG